MEFLKDLFTEPLSFEAFTKAVNEKGFKLADISNGEYVARDKFDRANEELKTARETLETMTGELETLKTNGADAESWKIKFEDLQKKMKDDEKDRAIAQAEAERKANVEARFNAACGDLKFSHPAIRESYLLKFEDALNDETNTGVGDNDIFHTLTKDDAGAFVGVTPEVRIPGAKDIHSGVTKEDFMKMGYADRLKLFNESPELYKSYTE